MQSPGDRLVSFVEQLQQEVSSFLRSTVRQHLHCLPLQLGIFLVASDLDDLRHVVLREKRLQDVFLYLRIGLGAVYGNKRISRRPRFGHPTEVTDGTPSKTRLHLAFGCIEETIYVSCDHERVQNASLQVRIVGRTVNVAQKLSVIPAAVHTEKLDGLVLKVGIAFPLRILNHHLAGLRHPALSENE